MIFLNLILKFRQDTSERAEMEDKGIGRVSRMYFSGARDILELVVSKVIYLK